MSILKEVDGVKAAFFAAGVMFGTAGIKLLSSKDAKKAYTHGTAAVLRARESILKTVTNFQENAEDIYAEAVQINEERAADEAEAEFEDKDAYKEVAEEGAETTAE